MPHINRIRVNNVKYNFGTQFYDDFVMRFSGQNTIYDLANGGGKSVLMLLLLQNLIPNCTLDEKQPIEKLFRSGNDNTVIHSLIEWKLNACDIKNGFQYMTTGFCARKAKDTALEGEEAKETAAIEYFNYCIFYREFQANDILNLPLSNGKERITFTGLRNYLRDLDKKDYNVQVHIFDRKGSYQSFISNYGLYESEWEIIRGINKTEGHVRTYFETHYKTTRKVIEDLFIEEIIEKSFKNQMEREEGESEIAGTLLDIKDKLVELSRKKGEISHYDSQLEVLESFRTRLTGLKGIYGKKAQLEEELVKTYNTVKDRLLRQKKELEDMSLEQEKWTDKRKNLTKNMENAAIVQEEFVLKGLHNTINSVRGDYEKLEAKCRSMELELKEKESANDYFDYLEQKKQLEIQNNALYSMSDNNEDILEELHTLAFNRKNQIDEEKKSLDSDEKEVALRVSQSEVILEEYKQEERQLSKEEAVLVSREKALSDSTKQLADALAKLQPKTGLLLSEDSQKEIAKVQRFMDELQEQIEDTEEKRQQADISYNKTVWEIGQLSDRIGAAQKEYEERKQQIEQYHQVEEKLGSMEAIYEEKGIDSLLNHALDGYKNIGIRIEGLRARLEMYQQCAKWQQGDVPFINEEVQEQVLEYVQRFYDSNAMFGGDYLMTLEPGMRAAILEKVPYLPYGIVVESHFLDITMDEKLLNMDLDGCMVPFVEKSTLEKLPQDLGVSKVYFVMKDNKVFYDKEALGEAVRESERRQQELQGQISRMEENEKVLFEDIQFLTSCAKQAKEMEKNKEKYQESLENLKSLHNLEESSNQQLAEAKAAKEKLLLILEEKKKELTSLKERMTYLEETKKLHEQFVDADKEVESCRNELNHIQKKLEVGLHNIEVTTGKLEEEKELLANIRSTKQQLDQNWKEYEPYYRVGSFPIIEMDKDELESLYVGRRIAFEQKNADATDKKQLVAVYQKAMEKSLQAIQYKGIQIEQLEKAYEEHRLVQTPLEQLMHEKSILEREQDSLANLSREVADHQTRIDRQEGSILHAKRSYEEKFGDYIPIAMSVERLGIYIAEIKEQLKAMSGEEKELSKKLKELEKDIYALTSMEDEIQRMIDNYQIPVRLYEGMLEPEVSLKDTYKMARKNYERQAREEQARREDFEKDKAKLIDTLKMLGAYDLGEEIGRSVNNPKSIQDVESHLENMGRTMQCIELEKERIGKGIENMEVIKDNFENRCLQTCSTIREALERLPNLSSITLDDKQVNMINLKIPYVKEDLYKERMSRYIDEIVEQADSLDNPAERLKFIRGKLAWKRLFSVIVTDMDRMKLQLYKRERMKEQSRYLKYEEAVGSTGQSQGIYIQFLVAVINYIASMNASNGGSSVLKKTVFLDNPFGAAKDVYIWEPIFKLLEANHVQLIVPARGATPAITGRFEVNYVLGQKLVDGRQQTVVVDYRSELDSTHLEYKEVEYEQASLNL